MPLVKYKTLSFQNLRLKKLPQKKYITGCKAYEHTIQNLDSRNYQKRKYIDGCKAYEHITQNFRLKKLPKKKIYILMVANHMSSRAHYPNFRLEKLPQKKDIAGYKAQYVRLWKFWRLTKLPKRNRPTLQVAKHSNTIHKVAKILKNKETITKEINCK